MEVLRSLGQLSGHCDHCIANSTIVIVSRLFLLRLLELSIATGVLFFFAERRESTIYPVASGCYIYTMRACIVRRGMAGVTPDTLL